MKILIAILSCVMRDKLGSSQAARETWARDISKYPGVEYRFFVGRGGRIQSDVVVVDAPDDYDGLTEKNREMQRWFVAHDYDFVFFCDDDTLIDMKRLMSSGFEQWDYYGRLRTVDTWCPFGYCCTGDGCWLSRKACEILAEAPGIGFADDVWMGNELGKHGIKLQHNGEFGWGITWHCSVDAGRINAYDSDWMRRKYLEERCG